MQWKFDHGVINISESDSDSIWGIEKKELNFNGRNLLLYRNQIIVAFFILW